MSIQMGNIRIGGTPVSDRPICFIHRRLDLAQVHLLLCMSRGRTGTGVAFFWLALVSKCKVYDTIIDRTWNKRFRTPRPAAMSTFEYNIYIYIYTHLFIRCKFVSGFLTGRICKTTFQPWGPRRFLECIIVRCLRLCNDIYLSSPLLSYPILCYFIVCNLSCYPLRLPAFPAACLFLYLSVSVLGHHQNSASSNGATVDWCWPKFPWPPTN